MPVPVTYSSQTNQPLAGVLASPPGSTPAGGVLVLHEWWGINRQIEDICDRFAAEGFLALAPDLYHGKRPETSHHASALAIGLERNRSTAEIRAAAAFVRAHPRCSGKVAVTGFCLGGAFAFGCACYLEEIAAAVPFYGVPRIPRDDYAKTRVPIQAHFARRDDWAKVGDAENIQQQVRAGGGQMDLFVYDAGHAFMRATDKHVYDPSAASLAWSRAIDFLNLHLGH